MESEPLIPALTAPGDSPALRFGDRGLTYAELAAAAGALAARLTDAGAARVAVWATPTLETAVGVVAALLAGVPAVPLNPRSGEGELGHIVGDSAPSLVLAGPGDELPAALAGLGRVDVRPVPEGPAPAAPREVSPAAPALVVYTSGTTGPPKGVVLPRGALAATLDALADAWQWTGDDVLVHGLPLFHVHGLILGVLGPLRRGGSMRHLGRFSTAGVARELASGATMLFGVPTMYHRVAEALPDEPELVKALAGARLLVSGSAALPVHDHERIASATGRRVIERYGMTETLMNTSVRADGAARAGTVGVPLPGVELRLVDEADQEVPAGPDGVGEIQVRGPNLFTEYLNRPDATAAAFADGGWFRTGDMAVREPDGYVRIVGRKATDLIKSGGYKIGAGEIENALLEHDGVREAAVTGEPDPDLGERVVAWIVPADPDHVPSLDELASHVATRLAPHKRPRTLRVLDALPRNDMGKILKRSLSAGDGD
ncbi:acyl-CoA synthetase [Streptomyces spectabilis]|uniref:Acyl-CoA synthetase n=1 Tax=Streptomyces spectabilis TaxID=68270 RepID=A0A5P2XB00_STRST|nr:acyl-CoA synthetase [Streptomyces spectabilis]MBB5103189.1 malonyl-CoA/methylmalonyl-CoA synthetase [Streptomyces spectabilis]MCI3902382.1 acyl-CoA synthetase [Streptomyces spectabilis]QEV59736.1 acyl-CoA synthetase [Streptomyces spectabilis]GGV14194.1 acyl-CoA synthetase [Streptomyces spectabilis]